MPVETNTFVNQSVVKDENKGAALDNATSAIEQTSEQTISAIDTAKAEILGALSKRPGGSFFKDGEFVLPKNIAGLAKLNGLIDNIKSAMASGMSFAAALKSALQNLASSILDQLKSESSETWAFLQSAGGTFLEAMKDKIKGVLLSRIYVPDAAFLAGLYAISGTPSDISYKDHYVRELCIKHDMPLSLEFVDKKEGVRYTFDNDKAVKDYIKAAKFGSIRVCHYIMENLYKELSEMRDIFPLPLDYDRKRDEKMYEQYEADIRNLRIRKESGNVTPEDEIAINIDIENYTRFKDELFINKEWEYEKDPMYSKIQAKIVKANETLHKLFKTMVVYSYSNLTPNLIKEEMSRFHLFAFAFGTKDTVYGKVATFSDTDINVMAPIYRPRKPKSFLAEVSDITKQTSYIKHKFEPKFIAPRNINIKGIYILLASPSIQKNKHMYHKNFYERLKLPVYSTTIEEADKALAGLGKFGLGKSMIGGIKTVDEAYYKYAVSMEPYLYSASKMQYISYNDLRSLPKLTETNIESNNKKSLKRPDRKRSPGNTSKQASSGPSVPSELRDPKLDLIESMNIDELKSLLKKLGLSDDEVNALSKDELADKLKEKIKQNTSYDINKLIGLMSKETLIDFLSKMGSTHSKEDLNKMDIERLKNLSNSISEGRVVDVNSQVVETKLSSYAKRSYMRKHFKRNEFELLKLNEDRLGKEMVSTMGTKEKKYIYHPMKVGILFKKDAEGFPILGSPSQETIESAVANNTVGYSTPETPNGFPVTTSGFICPIIGYDAFGKAMYGIPVFYPDTDPLGTDLDGRPVFSYAKDVQVLDELNVTETDLVRKYEINNNKIKVYKKYIKDGANGMLTYDYRRKIKNLKRENEYFKNILDLIKIRPIVGYTEFGDKVFGEINPLYNITTYDGFPCIGYDLSGKPIIEITDTKKYIIGYDSNGQPKYGTGIITPLGFDKEGKIVYGFDEDRYPVYGFMRTGTPIIKRNDSLVPSTKKLMQAIGKTNTGESVYGHSDDGNLHYIGFDYNRLPIIYAPEILDYAKKQKLYLTQTIEQYTISGANFLKVYYYKTRSDLDTDIKIINYIKEKGLRESYNEYLNDNVVDKLSFDISQDIITRYLVEIDKCELDLKTYDVLITATPIPPVVGYTERKVPLLGEPLIYSYIYDIPNLDIAKNNRVISGSGSNPNSVLNKTDLDIDKDFAQAERELADKAEQYGRIYELLIKKND